jgi:hypothetical protein
MQVCVLQVCPPEQLPVQVPPQPSVPQHLFSHWGVQQISQSSWTALQPQAQFSFISSKFPQLSIQ